MHDSQPTQQNEGSLSKEAPQRLAQYVERNLFIAGRIIDSVDRGGPEAALHLLRAWRGLALLCARGRGESPTEDAAIEELFRESDLPFTSRQTFAAWKDDLNQLAAYSAAPALSDTPYDMALLRRQADFLDRSLRRVKRTLFGTPRSLKLFVRALIVCAVFAVAAVLASAAWKAFRPKAPWRAEFYGNPRLFGEPVLVTDHLLIDFDWSSERPLKVSVEQWSVRWDTCLHLEKPLELVMEAGADDGIRVWIDGKQHVDMWRQQGFTVATPRVELDAGTHHVRIEYFQQGGAAAVRVKLHQESEGALTSLPYDSLRYPRGTDESGELCK